MAHRPLWLPAPQRRRSPADRAGTIILTILALALPVMVGLALFDWFIEASAAFTTLDESLKRVITGK